MLTKEDLKYCLHHYPQVAEHIKTVAIQRYDALKIHEQCTTCPDFTVEDPSSIPDQLNLSQNDDQEKSKHSWVNKWLIVNPESYIGQTITAIGHIIVLVTSLILPYQVNNFVLL